jgi:hypothetical protein
MVAGGEHCQFRAAIEVLVPYSSEGSFARTMPRIVSKSSRRGNIVTSSVEVIYGAFKTSGASPSRNRKSRSSRHRHTTSIGSDRIGSDRIGSDRKVDYPEDL